METMGKLPRAKCVVCGKETPVRDIRNKKPVYCCRAHAAMARYQKRYTGANAGKADRPNIEDKLKGL